VTRPGDPSPAHFSPFYHGQALVHGMGFSPDHHRIAVVSIGSNEVTLVGTETNTPLHTSDVGRSPHEAFFTPGGSARRRRRRIQWYLMTALQHHNELK
jgi:DNA-binding beta-propeller fold protein YncE